jgi:hypothetical protein
MEYLTMVCDIKGSRNIRNREELQYRLINMLKEANTLFKDNLISPFIITLGDEWQGLFKYPFQYDLVINFFKTRLGDVTFYCGLGVGDITIHNFELTVNQLDGPSFHNARTALSIAKESNYSIVLIK